MIVVGVIQARMGSSRLPGKVMLPLGGVPVLEHDIRVQRAAHSVDAVVVATTERPEDDVIEQHARRLGVDVHRGSEDDVLGRVHAAARDRDADVAVRHSGDHPLLDPAMVDAAVERVTASGLDLVTNRLRWSFPRGTAVEAFSADAMTKLDRLADHPEEREKVSRAYETHLDQFAMHHLVATEVFDGGFLDEFGDLTRFRVVLDNPADYERLWQLYEGAEYSGRLPLRTALRMLEDRASVDDT